MKVSVDVPEGWILRGSELIRGTLIVSRGQSSDIDRTEVQTTVTRDGWRFELAESRDATVAYFVATVELADETASLIGKCPIEDLEQGRAGFLELVRTARPSWPETLLLSELLDLPAVD